MRVQVIMAMCNTASKITNTFKLSFGNKLDRKILKCSEPSISSLKTVYLSLYRCNN